MLLIYYIVGFICKIKVILCSYLTLKKMNKHITDS